PFVVTFEDVLRCKKRSCEFYIERPEPVECGDTVLVWGDYFGAADAVEKLGFEGKKVFVVTKNKEFASWMEPCHRDVMMKRMAGGNGEGLKTRTYAHPVTVITESTVVEIKSNGEVVIEDREFNKSTIKVDNVVLAQVECNDDLYQQLLDAGMVVAKIGDAKKVRNLRGAVTDGANIGLTLDLDLMMNANNSPIANLPTEVKVSG
ncbi:MAG TPA: hypothetical protein PK016_07545, partial [Candidatus Atribacteria bacterium]|nr:hypothetical protein [Candidatus Atribacteria bacterium]